MEAGSRKKHTGPRHALSRGKLRTSRRVAVLTMLAMSTSVGLVATAAATPAPDNPLPGLGALGGVAGATSGGGQSASPVRDLPLPLLGGNSTQSGPSAGLPLLGGGSALPGATSLLPGVGGGADAGTTAPGQQANVWTPGATANPPDGPTYFGAPSGVATAGAILPSGEHQYPADPVASNFNGATGGWYAYQEYSPLCTIRGVGCVNWNFHHETTGGPAGDGDGFIRVNGTSLGVAPCTPQNGVARWVSPQFTYSTPNAQSWKIEFDQRQTQLLFGEGHSASKIEILDEAGRVVTTAYGPEGTFPLNKWSHREASFDGSKLVYGKNYAISIVVDVVHAETALNWGNLDFDNIVMTVGTEPGPAPAVPCTIDGSTMAGVPGLPAQLVNGQAPDLCPTTNQLGQALAPALDTVYCLLACGALNGPMDKLKGVFIVGDLETGQLVGYLFGKEAIPSIDPRDLLAYLKDGTEGKLVGYVVLFAGKLLELVKEVLSDPLGNVASLTEGQLGNLTTLLADPGRLTRIPLDWSLEDLKWVLSTALTPVLSSTPASDTALGGMVFRDDNRNGTLDGGEPGVPNVRVKLTDANGTTHATVRTGPDGRYLFTGLQPRTDPSNYYLTFERPDGMSFTQKHVPGSVHANTSNPDPETGRTDRIGVSRGQVDLEWHAGLVGATTPEPQPEPEPEPDPATVGISVGTPTVDGQSAATSPGPTVDAGSEITITVPITNTGNVPLDLSNLNGVGQPGQLNCGEGQVMPGQTVNCTLTTTAQPGTNKVTITFSVPDTSGQALTVTGHVYYTGRQPCGCDRSEAI